MFIWQKTSVNYSENRDDRNDPLIVCVIRGHGRLFYTISRGMQCSRWPVAYRLIIILQQSFRNENSFRQLFALLLPPEFSTLVISSTTSSAHVANHIVDPQTQQDAWWLVVVGCDALLFSYWADDAVGRQLMMMVGWLSCGCVS